MKAPRDNGNRFHLLGEHDDMQLNDQLDAFLALLRRRQYTERDYEISFTLHQHPYVSDLTRRLLRGGTRELQAADTLQIGDGISLPGSVRVNLPADAAITLDASARITLFTDVTVGAGNNASQLTAGMVFDLDAAVAATAPDGVLAVLTDGTTGTPAPGSTFSVAGLRASAAGPTKVVLSAAAAFTLYSGKVASLPAATVVVLDGGSRFTLPGGAEGVLVSSKARPVLFAEFFEAAYRPDPEVVQLPYPVTDLDFSSSGPYAAYNWELFFHVPMMIAVHLSKNQRYAEAQQWFPLPVRPDRRQRRPYPATVLKVRPFQETDVIRIEELLTNLATGADPQLRDDRSRHRGLAGRAVPAAPSRPVPAPGVHVQDRDGIPGQPARLGRLAALAGQRRGGRRGDDTNRLAAAILGPRPQAVPQKGTVRPQTYANLRRDLQEFGVVMRDVEADVPFDLMPLPAAGSGADDQLSPVRSLVRRCTFRCRPTTGCSATGTPSPTGCSRSATASTCRAPSGSSRCSSPRSTRECW